MFTWAPMIAFVGATLLMVEWPSGGVLDIRPDLQVTQTSTRISGVGSRGTEDICELKNPIRGDCFLNDEKQRDYEANDACMHSDGRFIYNFQVYGDQCCYCYKCINRPRPAN